MEKQGLREHRAPERGGDVLKDPDPEPQVDRGCGGWGAGRSGSKG